MAGEGHITMATTPAAKFRERFSAVERFLRGSAPTDVLMPAVGKAPAFAHKDRRWNWRAYDELLRCQERVPSDACVLLDQLCVIDVDSAKQADDLEARFPCLTNVPCEATARGRHYWFRRSARADAGGYYDGAGQRERGVDFKTRCRTGTAGIIVVAPSADRRWLRHLSDSVLEVIPDDILDAVAVPRTPWRSMVMVFEGGEKAEVRTQHADSMVYFEPFLDDWSDVPCVPVPCSEGAMRSLLRILDYVENSNPYAAKLPPGRAFKDALALMDKLGGDAAALRERLVRGPAFWRADLRASWPEMDAALELEAGNGEGSIVDVGPGEIRYQGMPGAEGATWLFSKDPWGSRHIEGNVVVPGFSAAEVEKVLPDVVRDAMSRHPLVLAGGAALALMTPSTLALSGGMVADWDLFPYGLDDEGADAMLSDIEGRMEVGNGWRTINTPRAVTYVRDPSASVCVSSAVQIVLRISDSPADVLRRFDLPPCKVAVYYDNGVLRAVASASWFVSMRHMAFPVQVWNWSSSSSMRVLKYVARGLDAMLPGVRRAWVREGGSKRCRGIMTLLQADKLMDGYRPGYKSLWLLQKELMLRYNTCVASDYESLVKARGGAVQLVYAVLKVFTRPENRGARVWNRSGSVCSPESARLWNVHPTGCKEFNDLAWSVIESNL